MIQSGKPFLSWENQKNPSFEEDSVKGIGKEKLDSLKEFIDEIQDMVRQREELSKIIINECDKMKTEITNFLLINTAVDSDGFKERNSLRQKQIEISELQLNEKLNCWRDVALLKRELRDKQKELSEKEGRAIMLDNLMKGGLN